MSGTASGSGQANGRANKRAKLDQDVDMNGQEENGFSKQADDLVSNAPQAGLTVVGRKDWLST
jgi:hypothetical protein